MSIPSVPIRLLRRLAPVALTIAVAASSGHATMSLGPLPLRQATAEAARIVHGRVTALRADRDEHGLPATWITLRVLTPLKGVAASELTVKQFGVAEPLPDGAAPAIIGMPRYAVGEEIVLFLYGESTLGFTSPIGMGQGVYRVRPADDAAAGARAARDAPDSASEQPTELTTLLDAVRTLVAHPDGAR